MSQRFPGTSAVLLTNFANIGYILATTLCFPLILAIDVSSEPALQKNCSLRQRNRPEGILGIPRFITQPGEVQLLHQRLRTWDADCRPLSRVLRPVSGQRQQNLEPRSCWEWDLWETCGKRGGKNVEKARVSNRKVMYQYSDNSSYLFHEKWPWNLRRLVNIWATDLRWFVGFVTLMCIELWLAIQVFKSDTLPMTDPCMVDWC